MQLVDQQQEFEKLCKDIELNESVIFMDTEFHRRKTYYAQLSIVQIAAKKQYFVIDILSLNNLQPLKNLLSNPDIIKVFHSPDQDFDIFFHLFGTLPKNVFDTQIAAGVIGFEGGMGYGRLCKKLLNIEIDKSMQTANWLTRPLRSELLVYAAKDVEYLIPLYRYLSAEIDSRNLWANYQARINKLTNSEYYTFQPQKILKKIWRYKYEQLPYGKNFSQELIEFIKLREDAAKHYNIPRNFCASDRDMVTLCHKLPQNESELKRLNLSKNYLEKPSFKQKLLNLCNGIAESHDNATL